MLNREPLGRPVTNPGLRCCQLLAVIATAGAGYLASQTESPVGKGLLIASTMIGTAAVFCCCIQAEREERAHGRDEEEEDYVQVATTTLGGPR